MNYQVAIDVVNAIQVDKCKPCDMVKHNRKQQEVVIGRPWPWSPMRQVSVDEEQRA